MFQGQKITENKRWGFLILQYQYAIDFEPIYKNDPKRLAGITAVWQLSCGKRAANGRGQSGRDVPSGRYPKGAFGTPKRVRRLKGTDGSSMFPRVLRSNCRSEGIVRKNTAIPDSRQSLRGKPRWVTGSGITAEKVKLLRGKATMGDRVRYYR